MKVSTGSLPTGTDDDGSFNVNHRVRDPDDLAKAFHQRLQLRNINQFGILDTMSSFHGLLFLNHWSLELK